MRSYFGHACTCALGLRTRLCFFLVSLLAKKPQLNRWLVSILIHAYVKVVEVIQFIFRNISLYVGLAPTCNICNT